MTTTAISNASSRATDSVAELLQGAHDRDPAAWEEVVRRYGTLVSTTVRSFRLQDPDALDAVQMTWLRLIENAHRINFPDKLGGWLVTTARRECLRILRRAHAAPDLLDGAPESIADPAVGPEQRVIDADTARTLHELVAELPPRRKIVLRALFSQNPLPYAEVARTAGIPPGAIGPTRARALQQLRSKLSEHEAGPRTPGPQNLRSGPHNRPSGRRPAFSSTT